MKDSVVSQKFVTQLSEIILPLPQESQPLSSPPELSPRSLPLCELGRGSILPSWNRRPLPRKTTSNSLIPNHIRLSRPSVISRTDGYGTYQRPPEGRDRRRHFRCRAMSRLWRRSPHVRCRLAASGATRERRLRTGRLLRVTHYPNSSNCANMPPRRVLALRCA